MYRACIAVVDASRARLFTYERSVEPAGLVERLVEERDFVNPARRLRPSQLFSESRPGSSRSGSVQYAFDDHRAAHLDALDAEFSRMITSHLAELVKTGRATRVILCASPHMLGQLRDARRDFPVVEIDEIARDLVKLTPPELRAQLTSYGLLPEPPARAPNRSASGLLRVPAR